MTEEAKPISRPMYRYDDPPRKIAQAIYDGALSDFVEFKLISTTKMAAKIGVGQDKARVIAACLERLLEENNVDLRPAIAAAK